MTIVEFIRARLDEDEQTALQDPHPEHSRPVLSYIDYGEIEIGTARVLAQVAAMRAIVDRYQKALKRDRDNEGDLAAAGRTLALHGVMKDLAAIWSDHPDYDPAWSPDA